MYGVPSDLDLSMFLGATLTHVGLGEFQIWFTFTPQDPWGLGGHNPSISAAGGWELRDAGGALVDKSLENAERDAYRVHRVFGRVVTSTSVSPPDSLSLRFDDGHELIIMDDLAGYESIDITGGPVRIII